MKFKDEEKILNKELSGSQLSKGYVESIIRMPYEEFENLDIEDQNKLIEEKTGRKLTFDDRLHIDGIPLDENHIKTIEQVDKQINKIVHESSAKKLIRKFKKDTLIKIFSFPKIKIKIKKSYMVYKPNFNYGEFAIIKSQAGLNSYKISVKEFERLKAEEQK